MKLFKKSISLLLTIIMLMSVFSIASVTSNAATAIKTQAEAVSWLKSQNNATYDFDGQWGTQCPEFVRAYVNWLLKGNAWTDAWGRPTLDGKDVWKNSLWAELGWKVYKNTADFLPQPGDIFSAGITNYGHTGVVISSTVSTATIADANGRNTVVEDGDPVYVHDITWGALNADHYYSPTYFIRPNFAGSGYTPEGVLDSVTSNSPGTITVRGWAFDRDNLNASLAIHVYVGGPAGTAGVEGHAITANTTRTDVNAKYPGVGNNHGFEATISVSKTGNQEVYVYALNTGAGSTNPVIGNKTVNIQKDSTAPTVKDITVSMISNSGYRVSCRFADNVGVTRVAFPTWTTNNGQDDLIWKDGTISGDTATFVVKKSDHNNEVGDYITHVYVYDKAGNNVNKSAGVITLTNTPQLVTEIGYNDNTYKVYNYDFTWSQAKEWCEKQGGHLATITSEAEWKIVLSALGKFNYTPCWLGAENTSGSYKWVTGEKFSYTAWKKDEPSGGTEHWLGSYGTGANFLNAKEWNDFNNESGTLGGFVCEFEKPEETEPTTLKPTSTVEPTETTHPTESVENTEPTETTVSIPTTESTNNTTGTEPSETNTDSTDKVQTNRYYFANTNNWEEVYCYYWSDEDVASCKWPGNKAKYLTTNCDIDYYYYDVPIDCTYIIWDNGAYNQTVDIPVDGSDNIFVPTEIERTSGFFSIYNIAKSECNSLAEMVTFVAEATADNAEKETTPKDNEEETTPKTEIHFTHGTERIYLKGKFKIKATVVNGKGETTYTSSNTKVATVGSDGVIKGKDVGTVLITVANNGVKECFVLKVKKPSLNVTEKTLKVKKSYKLKITGQVGKATFKSTNTKVATVNSKGKIVAKKKGTAVIKVMTNGITLKCKIKVKK